MRPTHRLLARLLADRLTRDLAGGRPPDSSRLHALCAQALLQPRRRIALAQSIVETVHAARVGDTPQGALTARWPHVRLACGELQALAERVRSRGPVSARGLAMVQLLVTDGGGPLYYSTSPAELVAASNAARAALDPLSTAG